MVRCLCNSRAYQRSSRPAGGNETDATWFSHRTVRVLRPDVLYDSLSVALYPPMPKGGRQGFVLIDRVNPIPDVSRDEFIRFFSTRADENTGSTVNQGIPQYLRLMNSSLLEEQSRGLSRFTKTQSEPSELARHLYLAIYSRPPSDEELQRTAEHFIESTDFQNAASGLFWALLNSSEFVLNH